MSKVGLIGMAAYGTNPDIAGFSGVRTDVDGLRTPEVRGLFKQHILDCLEAGSDFLATDTFPARRLLQVSGKAFSDLVREHLAVVVELHQELGLKLPTTLLAFGPVGDCYLPGDQDRLDAAACAAAQIGYGIGGRARELVDAHLLEVLFETVPGRDKLFGTVDAILQRIAKWPKGHRVPNFTVSLVIGDDGNFRDGESAAQCLHDLLMDSRFLRLCNEGKLKFGLNCVDHNAVKNFLVALRVRDVYSNVDVSRFVDYLAMNGADGNPWDAEAAAGRGEVVEVNPDRPQQIVEFARGLFQRVAVCCGLGANCVCEMNRLLR